MPNTLVEQNDAPAEQSRILWPKHFDRELPISDWRAQHHITTLRQRGAARRAYYSHRFDENWRNQAESVKRAYFCSAALRKLLSYCLENEGIYLDLGCGDSADAHVMKGNNFYAFGLDLYPPSKPDSRCAAWALIRPPLFIQADLTQRIPFESNSVMHATCAAVIDLMTPAERLAFYSEVFRVLKPGGCFCITFQKLSIGFGFNAKHERTNILDAGFWRANKSAGIAFIKPRHHNFV